MYELEKWHEQNQDDSIHINCTNVYEAAWIESQHEVVYPPASAASPPIYTGFVTLDKSVFCCGGGWTWAFWWIVRRVMDS